MRKLIIAIFCIIAFFLDSVFFSAVGLYNFRPEALIALLVSLGVLMGWAPTMAIGIGLGLLLDILCNKYVGLSALAYVGAAWAGGFFFEKYYADNLIVPSLTAAAVMFLKEHLMLFVVLLTGGRVSNYLMLLVSHMLPASILTGVLCLLFHMILRRTAFVPGRRRGA